MKHVDQPWEAYQIFETCEDKMNIFLSVMFDLRKFLGKKIPY